MMWIARFAAGTCALATTAFLSLRLTTWISGCILTFCASTMARGQQASMAAQASRPEAAILGAAETYRQAVLNQDAETLNSLFREDAIEMPPYQAPVTGRNAIAQFYQASFHSSVKVTAFTFSHSEVIAQDDLAYDVGAYTRRMTTPGGPTEVSGPFVAILKHSAGKWQIAYLIYNCECPSAPMQPHSQTYQ
jgi:uncharacterized protein (TIGR02246 family)